METELLARELRRALPGLWLLENELMNRHCSFRIGGPADLFAEPATETELAALRQILWEKGVEAVTIGNGTNILAADEGIRGVVIHIGDALGGTVFDDRNVTAGAGITLAQLAVAAKDHGLTGLEFAHGIPGSLGGAVMMNAGAYGGEMKDVVASVRCMNEKGEVWETAEPEFSYRHSRFSDGTDLILGASLRLTPGDPAAIQARMTELIEKRSASQPLEKPSAGSAFKRPKEGYAAAMIDGAGLKGFRVGGAQVSEKHAGFIVNTGGATSADVRKLMELVQEKVLSAYGVLLEPEIKFIP